MDGARARGTIHGAFTGKALCHPSEPALGKVNPGLPLENTDTNTLLPRSTRRASERGASMTLSISVGNEAWNSLRIRSCGELGQSQSKMHALLETALRVPWCCGRGGLCLNTQAEQLSATPGSRDGWSCRASPWSALPFKQSQEFCTPVPHLMFL